MIVAAICSILAIIVALSTILSVPVCACIGWSVFGGAIRASSKTSCEWLVTVLALSLSSDVWALKTPARDPDREILVNQS